LHQLNNQIKQEAEENIKNVLTNRNLLLQFAIFLVIESLTSNPELSNFVIHDNSNDSHSSYASNYPSSMLSGREQQSFNNSYTALILEDAEKLYNELTTELIHRVMAAADIRASSLPPANNRQNDTYQTEEYRYNNQS
jgi:hypothetical protein